MRPAILLASAALAAALPASAQDGYRLPPQGIVDLVTAAPAPSVSISPDGAWMLMTHREALPSIEDLTRPMLRLAGMRIDPQAAAPFTTSFGTRVVLSPLMNGDTQGTPDAEVQLPRGARVAGTSWSPDGARFVVTVVTDGGSELWTGRSDGGGATRLVTDRLHTLAGGPSWGREGTTVLCRLVPEGRGEAPVASTVPTGPNVQETDGSKSPLRTYQDLLTSAHDADTWEYHATSELAIVDLDTSEVTSLGTGVFSSASLSPDGLWLMTSRIQRPYSFLMPAYSFPQRIEVAPISKLDAPAVAFDIPLGEGIPIGGVRTGPRSFQWAASRPATLFWAEALDGGDPKAEVEHRDRWMAISAPFARGADGALAAEEVVRVEHRARGLMFLEDPGRLITSEYDRDRRWTRTLLHELGGDGEPLVLEDRSSQDRYADPGVLAMVAGPYGRMVVREHGGGAFRTGRGSSPDGDLPFLSQQDLGTGETKVLWRCEPGAYETVVALPWARGFFGPFVTRRESKTAPPNYVIRRPGLSGFDAVTDFPDPQPSLRGIKKQRVTYERADGVPLSATLYLPADHQPGERLPLLVWGYPREYNDASTAGQVSGSTDRFTRLSGTSHLFLVTQGYAVMDGATMPIIGDAETMNDTFITQLVASAKAAIDAAAELGVADPERVGVAGHSYGAFMTTNLLAHCDLFRAGIARSGAYNRTLTPFGFQSERRTFWQAPETYFAVSPFMHAHKINEPVLLIHGEADNNSGTFPVQSKRLYQAIKGNGGSARLVMLPGESHGYRARESVLHVLAEMVEWMDTHVKGAGD